MVIESAWSTSAAPQSLHRRILFVGEAVTLAHVVRPVVLAQALDLACYEVVLACDNRYLKLFGQLPLAWRPIETIPTVKFLDNLARGWPVYDLDTLRRYVRADLVLLEAVKPDVVVGDFRISLGVSARVAGVPYFTITNAYWSPYSRLPFPLPEHPMIPVFGVGLSQALFNLARPAVFALHTLPLNRVRREYGLPSLGYDLRTIYTDADQTLYADIPDFIPTAPLPPHHHWLGPVLWSPAMELPDWWETLPSDRPIIYVALGSSGENVRALPVILRGLAELPVTVIAATAGQSLGIEPPKNAYVADFLPGVAAAARSHLVVCNGGSLATQQALAAGVPVLGIAGNMDQHLNMLCLEQAGVGVRLRVGRLIAGEVRTAAQRLLDDTGYRQEAGRLRQVINAWDTGRVFVEKLVWV
ncbi:MAG TPA: glycosyltransferase [Candidatus Competibacteraceae bacterium]|nr:glycosyltransferase [Candidatus Competibacteraceae bacterium]HRZ06052.1 glycosyltransferase [Candidatus Competibacteraceae bacterium]HSA45422.1 glycosyltransferase [Candidatus Competibacteraceae bacterium]